VKLILAIIYSIFTVLALVHLFRYLRIKKVFNNRAILQVLLFVAPLVRAVLLALPTSFYIDHIQPHQWLQIFLDLFAEVLFWQVYVVLVLIWAELFHFSRNIRTHDMDNSMTIGFGVITVLVYIAVCGVTTWLAKKNEHYISVLIDEVYFLGALICMTIVCFTVYGCLLHNRMKRVPFFPVNRKKNVLNKFKNIVVIVVLCNISHVVFLYFIDTKFFDLKEDNKITIQQFRFIWGIYLLLTEFVPVLAVFVMFRKLPKKPAQYTEIMSTA